VHGDARARSRSRIGRGGVRAPRQARRLGILLDDQPQREGVRVRDRRRRARPQSPAEGDARVRAIPAAERARGLVPERRARSGRDARPRVQPADAALSALGRHQRQLPRRLPQGGMTAARLAARPGAVLFDLDGTLIDSAPDLAGACNEMRVERGLAPLPYPDLRRMVGSAARGMVGGAFGLAPGDAGYEALRDEFLARYEARMTRETRVFEAMLPVLAWLAEQGMPWGIVTNKATRFAAPLIASLGLAEQASTLVCGDTVAHAKPHPAPLLEAAARLQLAPAACVYVGDDRRDVDAGRAAAMATVVATWGYLGAGDAPEAWGA